MPFTTCPHCKQQIKFDDEDIGLTATCPYCSVDFELRAKKKAKKIVINKKPDWRDTGVVHHVDGEWGCLGDLAHIAGTLVLLVVGQFIIFSWLAGGSNGPSTNNNDFSGDAGQEAASETLLIAAQNGNIKAVKRHLASGADVDEIMLGQTPLYSAAHYGYKEIAELLIANGANVNFRSQILFGKTPLHAAASEGYKDIVKLLIANGANVNAKESLPSRRTPLYGAIHDGHKEIVQMLIANGANINVNENSENGPSPLEWAISFEQSEIASILRRRGAKSRL